MIVLSSTLAFECYPHSNWQRGSLYKNTQCTPLSGPGGSLLKSVTYKCLSLTCRCSVRNATGLLCFKPSSPLLQQMYFSINSKYILQQQIIYLRQEITSLFNQYVFLQNLSIKIRPWNCSCKENEIFWPQMHVSFPHAIKLIRSEDILIRHDMNSDSGHLYFMLFEIFSQRLQNLFYAFIRYWSASKYNMNVKYILIHK